MMRLLLLLLTRVELAAVMVAWKLQQLAAVG
jgi:hypothetical protein